LDGEAVGLCPKTGLSLFDELHSGRGDCEILYAFGLPELERRVWKQKGARSRLCENERLRAIRGLFC